VGYTILISDFRRFSRLFPELALRISSAIWGMKQTSILIQKRSKLFLTLVSTPKYLHISTQTPPINQTPPQNHLNSSPYPYETSLNHHHHHQHTLQKPHHSNPNPKKRKRKRKTYPPTQATTPPSSYTKTPPSAAIPPVYLASHRKRRRISLLLLPISQNGISFS